jgi:ketosteroid isomerase-like protein
MAEEMGYAKAFTEYAHPDAVLLRKNSMPVTGKPAIEKLFGNKTPDNVHFSWQPLNGDIAGSGELGYTYGIYTLETDSNVERGTYVSIWKKDNKGEWKYILDSGNEGTGN